MRLCASFFALALLACSSSSDHAAPIRNAPEPRPTKQAPPAPPVTAAAAEVPRPQHLFDLRTTSMREVRQLPHGIEDIVAPEAIGRRVTILRALHLEAEGQSPAWLVAYLTPPPPARHPCNEGEEDLAADDDDSNHGPTLCGVMSLAYVDVTSSGMQRVRNEQLDDDFCRNSEESYGQISVGEPARDPEFAFLLSVSDIDGDARNEVVVETSHPTHSECPTGAGETEKYAMLDLETFRHELFVTKRIASGGMTGAIESFQDVHVALRDVDGDGRKDFVMRRTMTSEGVATDCGDGPARVAHSEGEYTNIINSGDSEDGEIPCARYEERTVRVYNAANDTFSDPAPYPQRGATGASAD